MLIVDKNYVLREINGFYILASCGKCENRKWIYELNSTGALIWKMCTCGIDLEILVEQLETHYLQTFTAVEENRIKQYIDVLKKESLLKEMN